MAKLGDVILRDTYGNIPAAGTAGRLFVATDTAKLYRDNGSTWDEIIVGAEEILPVDVTNVTNPPTNTELVSALGTAAAAGAGFVTLLDDNNGNTAVYLVVSNGTSWWYQLLTKAV